MEDSVNRQIKGLMKQVKTGQTSCGNARTVVSPCQLKLFSFGLYSQNILRIKHQFDLRFVCIRTGKSIINFTHSVRSPVNNTLWQFNNYFIGMTDISVITCWFFWLFVDSVSDFYSSVTDIYTIESLKCIQKFCAMLVFNVNSVTALNNFDRKFIVACSLACVDGWKTV